VVNAALVKMDAWFSGMYEADIKGGRPSIEPPRVLRRLDMKKRFTEEQIMGFLREAEA